MHLGGACFAQHAHHSALGVAANDRVIHDHYALAAQHGLQGVELELDAQLAQGLRRLDEGTAHIGVLHEAVGEGNAGFLRVADGRRGAGFWNRDDDVGFSVVLAGQLAAHFHAGLVDRAAGDGGIRASQVDVLENAALGGGVGEAGGAHAVFIDGDHFAWLDFADE